MEHRCTIRRRHRCEVIVNGPTNTPAQVRSGNISAGGLFVETDGTRFAVNTAVTVNFRLAYENHIADLQMPAMVVRVAPRGVALMFLEIDAKTFDQLDKALQAIRKTAAWTPPSEGLNQEIDTDVRVGPAV